MEASPSRDQIAEWLDLARLRETELTCQVADLDGRRRRADVGQRRIAGELLLGGLLAWFGFGSLEAAGNHGAGVWTIGLVGGALVLHALAVLLDWLTEPRRPPTRALVASADCLRLEATDWPWEALQGIDRQAGRVRLRLPGHRLLLDGTPAAAQIAATAHRLLLARRAAEWRDRHSGVPDGALSRLTAGPAADDRALSRVERGNG